MAHSSLCGHRKLGRLCAALDIGAAEAVGTLELLWWAADFERVGPDGVLHGWTDVDLAFRCQWHKGPSTLVTALLTAGFLERDTEGNLLIHDWAEWARDYIKRRWRRDGWNANGQQHDTPQTTTGPPVTDHRSTTDRPVGPLRNATQRNGKKKSTSSSATPRKPDPIWDTVEEQFFGGDVGEDEKTRCGKLVAGLKRKKATAEDIPVRRQRLVDLWGSKCDTAESLVKHWDKFDGRGPQQSRPGRAAAPPGKYDHLKSKV